MSETFGNYEILRKLASGGMAEVLLAKQRGMGGFERLVCLKRILPHLSGQAEFTTMFQDEARIAATLLHPNIAQIYDIGEVQGTYYIAMEYVRGEDLRRVYNQEVARGQAMSPQVAAHVAVGAAAGLDHAHRQASISGRPLGIVHRDVSPQNVLITYDGHIKLVDFGVAKAAGKMLETRSGVLKGKYSYMAPEQAAGDPVDPRTDVFALGITLYEVTTGTRLFKRETELETLQAVAAGKVTPPSEILPDYPSALNKIVMRALAKDPDDRFATAADFGAALETYLRQESYSATASTLAEYMQRLFQDKMADQALFGDDAWGEEAPTPSGAPKRLRAQRKPTNGKPTNDKPKNQEEEDAANEPTLGTDAATAADVSPDIASQEALDLDQDRATATRIDAPPSEQKQAEIAEDQVNDAWEDELQPNSASFSEEETLAREPSPQLAARKAAMSEQGDATATQAYDLEALPNSSDAEASHADPSDLDSNDEDEDEDAFEPKALLSRSESTLTLTKPKKRRRLRKVIGALVATGVLAFIFDANDLRTRTLARPQKTIEPAWSQAYIAQQIHHNSDRAIVEAHAALKWVRRQSSEASEDSDEEPKPSAKPSAKESLRRAKKNRDTASQIASKKPKPAVPQNALDAEIEGEEVSIRASIPLDVLWHGKHLGTTPLDAELPAGTQTLKLQNPREGFALDMDVTVYPQTANTITVDETPTPLVVDSQPNWAWVQIGAYPGVETPFKRSVIPGTYSLITECPNGRRKKHLVKVASGKEARLKVRCQL